MESITHATQALSQSVIHQRKRLTISSLYFTELKPMEVTPSIKQKTVSVFESNHRAYAHWNADKEQFETRIHCGYISEAPTEAEAMCELISMVRPMHYDLGERMMDSVKNFGVKAR